VNVLRAKYGAENVIATDIKKPAKASFLRDGPFLYADVVDYPSLAQIVVEHKIDWLIHNSSILSASGERNPQLALEVCPFCHHFLFSISYSPFSILSLLYFLLPTTCIFLIYIFIYTSLFLHFFSCHLIVNFR
jgi:hypothetical protein